MYGASTGVTSISAFDETPPIVAVSSIGTPTDEKSLVPVNEML